MKKTAFLLICAILSAAAFGGCAAPEKTLANSYKFGYFTEEPEGHLEHYVYDVTTPEKIYSETETAPNYDITGSGTYTVDLYKNEDNTFRLVTLLSFEGRYKYNHSNTYSDMFTDTVSGESLFRIGAGYFTAISSVKTFNTTMPYTSQNGGYVLKKSSYTASTAYNETGMNSTVKDNNIEGVPEELTAKISNKNNAEYSASLSKRFYDNEQIFTGLRVQPLSTAFSDSFYVPDPLNARIQTVNVSASQDIENKAFGKNEDNTEKLYECIKLTAAIDSTYKGGNIVMYYTQNYSVKYNIKDGNSITPMDNSTNISLLIQFSQGNFAYTLKDYTNYASKVNI